MAAGLTRRFLAPVVLACAVAPALLPSPARAATPDERRFLQIFFEDAAVVENGWFEAQFRFQNLSGDADALRIGPVFAFSPIDRLEIGGRFDFVDIDFGATSESGVSDTTVYGKWQFYRNPVQFAVGGELSLPTGDEDNGLGTGEVDPTIFASIRKDLPDVTLTGMFGFRFNNDASIGGGTLEGKTSIFLGGGAMFPVQERFSLSGELTIETERYESADSAVELTAGAYWYATDGFTLRGGLGIGLDDGSPDWELIVGAAWHF